MGVGSTVQQVYEQRLLDSSTRRLCQKASSPSTGQTRARSDAEGQMAQPQTLQLGTCKLDHNIGPSLHCALQHCVASWWYPNVAFFHHCPSIF